MKNDASNLCNPLIPIVPAGTQVVSRLEIKAPSGHPLHPVGVVGVIVSAPGDHQHAYRVRFPDNYEAALKRHEFVTLRDYQRAGLEQRVSILAEHDLQQSIIYRCVIGSRAYGLADEDSDTDRRGVFLPPAELHWSLCGVPEQLEDVANQECYWELQKVLTLALKANPNVLECLYSPIVETVTPLGQELLALRHVFLSKLIYQTYNGYVLSQFKKLQSDLRLKGEVKWKHVMHLVRLLLAGIGALRTGMVPVRVEEHRETLLSIKHGQRKWADVNQWRLELHAEFDQAAIETKLPDRPDYEMINAFLIHARRSMADRTAPINAPLLKVPP